MVPALVLVRYEAVSKLVLSNAAELVLCAM
jgi:hypothetical protein